jgi:hypothetical protein
VAAWLTRAGEALRIGAQRADLWPAGALAWLAYVGWLPLILAVAPPDGDAVESFGVSMYLSESFPFNVVLLAAGLVLGFAALCLLASGAEVALHELAAPGATPSHRDRATLSVFAVTLLASVPMAGAISLAAAAAIAAAPAEYLSNDLATPVLLRILGDVVPLLVLASIVLVLVQAVAGAAIRQVMVAHPPSALHGLSFAMRELRHRPVGTIGLAFTVAVLDAAMLAVTIALLRVLWSPIGSGLGDGLLKRPETLPLLVGFVAIWLGLMLAAGALHVAASAWWSAQRGESWRSRSEAGSETGDPQ